MSDHQLPFQFSIRSSVPIPKILFEIDKQPGWVLKSTNFVHFQSLTNSRNCFEICHKKLSMQFDFARFLSKVDLS